MSAYVRTFQYPFESVRPSGRLCSYERMNGQKLSVCGCPFTRSLELCPFTFCPFMYGYSIVRSFDKIVRPGVFVRESPSAFSVRSSGRLCPPPVVGQAIQVTGVSLNRDIKVKGKKEFGVWIFKEGKEYLIASISVQTPHVSLNLILSSTEVLVFRTTGHVYLSGFFVTEFTYFSGESTDPNKSEELINILAEDVGANITLNESDLTSNFQTSMDNLGIPIGIIMFRYSIPICISNFHT